MLPDNTFPTVDNCDPTVPEEAFVPFLVGAPGLNGAPLMMPVEYLRLVSRRLWDCGCRPGIGAPTIKYRRPSTDDPHWMTSPGQWVSVDEPDPENPTLKDVVESMPQAERMALATHLGLAPQEKVPYVRKDGTTVLVSQKQADAWRKNRK